MSRIVAPGLIKWGTRDGREITRWDARLRLIEDTPSCRVRQDSADPDSD